MRAFLRLVAHLYAALWWHVRIDPSGYVKRSGLVFAGTSGFVALCVGTVAMLSNLMLGDIALASNTGNAGSSQDSSASESTAPTLDDQGASVVSTSAGPVPGTLFSIYRDAARQCDMPWEVLAAVGWVESHHGELMAPGVHSGANFAGASGPMQFLSATWAAYGVDADKSGTADVYDPADSIHGAANYLCANGAGGSSTLRGALYNYNHSWSYVDEVLGVAKNYTENTYVLPLPVSAVTDAELNRPHHDYPSADVDVPVGTSVAAAHGGRVHAIDDGRCGRGVVIDGNDGATYTYCHLSERSVDDGSTVGAGDPLGQTGGLLGESGAGSSTTPHLHFQIAVGGSLVCPQSLLVDWKNGHGTPPSRATSSGCSY